MIGDGEGRGDAGPGDADLVAEGRQPASALLLDDEVAEGIAGCLELRADAARVREEILVAYRGHQAPDSLAEGGALCLVDAVVEPPVREVLGVRPELDAPGEVE